MEPRGLLATAACTLAACGGGGSLPDTPRITGKLPDAGITADQCHGTGSAAFVSCTDAAALAFNAQQDGMTGLDVTDADHSDGKAGSAAAPRRTRPLGMRQGQHHGPGLGGPERHPRPRAMALSRYTHYGDHRSGDASAYVRAVNASGLCGFQRLAPAPQQELQGLIDLRRGSPRRARIDSRLVRAHARQLVLVSTGLCGTMSPWPAGVQLGLGTVEPLDRASAAHVRLVR